MRVLIVLLVLAVIGSNAVWYRAYRKLDLRDMRTEAYLDWSNDLLKSCK